MMLVWPWALFALLPVVLAAWWALRQPARQIMPVSSLRLWQQAAEAVSPAAQKHRRHVSAAWVLILLGAVLAAFALARPVAGRDARSRRVALEVYPSAELAGLPEGAIADAAGPLLERLSGEDQVEVILPAGYGPAEVLSPQKAMEKLRGIEILPVRAEDMTLPQAAPQRGSVEGTMRTAESTQTVPPGGPAVVVGSIQHTYRIAPATLALPAGPDVTNILLPARPGDLTIDAFAAEPAGESAGQLAVFLAVRNHTDKNLRGQAMLYRAGSQSPAAALPLDVPAGGRQSLQAALPDSDYVCAALDGQKGPGSRACLARRRVLSARVAMVGRDDPLVRRFIDINPALRLVSDPAGAEVVISVGAAAPPGKPALVIDPPAPPPGYRAGPELANLPLRQANLQADSPLLKYVDLSAVAVRRTASWQEGDFPAGQPVVLAGQNVLILAADQPRRVYVAFDLSAENTNFGLTDSFVAFMANAMNYLLPTGRRAEVFSSVVPAQASANWRPEAFAAGESSPRPAFSLLPQPGLYRDSAGEFQAVSLPGLRSAPSPSDPAAQAAAALLPEPINRAHNLELWPILLSLAGVCWLAGWICRMR